MDTKIGHSLGSYHSWLAKLFQKLRRHGNCWWILKIQWSLLFHPSFQRTVFATWRLKYLTIATFLLKCFQMKNWNQNTIFWNTTQASYAILVLVWSSGQCALRQNSFFKRVVHNVHNFKNILQTLSTQHQLMVAHVMQSPRFFKQSIHVDKVKVVKVSSLERKVKTAVEKKICSP